jgi:MFS family permease
VESNKACLEDYSPLFQGFSFGPIIWGPLSELYGRRVPLFIGYTLFAVFQIPVAVAQNIETILILRFVGGICGAAPLAVVAGTLADIWNPVDRGVAVSHLVLQLYLDMPAKNH